jgi:hypothetical protein
MIARIATLAVTTVGGDRVAGTGAPDPDEAAPRVMLRAPEE